MHATPDQTIPASMAYLPAGGVEAHARGCRAARRKGAEVVDFDVTLADLEALAAGEDGAEAIRLHACLR